ncbi:hypothetical protein C1645_832646, partial [Glomus cerebriforme]
LPSDKLSDKLAFLEANPSANIKKTLGGEELLAIETTILESFVTGKNYIIIVPPPPHFTFKKCVDEKKLVPGDKIIYQYTISPSDIKSNNWRNLWIELCDSKEKLIWRDFRHRMLNESNDITNRTRMLKLESVSQSSQQTEGENSIEDDTKISKKDAIDRILKSQSVYAIGPIFHENNTFPFIACWGEKSLSQPILEDLEKLFDYEFKVVSHQIIELVHCGNELSSNSGASGGSRGSKKGNHNSDGSSNGSRDDSDDLGRVGRDDGGDGNAGNKKGIMVTSMAFARSEDCNNKQQFVINLNLHAKINESSEIPKFSIDIDGKKRTYRTFRKY